MLGNLPRTLTPRDLAPESCSFLSPSPALWGRRGATERPPSPAPGDPGSPSSPPRGPRSTHVSQRSEPGCPEACGLGRWWRSGCRFHSCWPECSWRGKGGAVRPLARGAAGWHLPTQPPLALLFISRGRYHPPETGGTQSPLGRGLLRPTMNPCGSSFYRGGGRGVSRRAGPCLGGCAPRTASQSSG